MAAEAVTRGRDLKAARIKKGLRQADAARELGIHPVTLSRIERGEQQKIDAKLYASMRRLYALQVGDASAPEASDADFVEGVASPWPEERTPPKVPLGLPQRIRVYIQEFLLELVNANVPEERVDTIRRILSSDEMYRFYVGGEPKEYSEEETLEGIQAHAEAFRQRLRRQGFKLSK